VETDGGGSVRLVVYDPRSSAKCSAQLRLLHRIFPDRDRVDHRILEVTMLVEEFNGTATVLVTKDLNSQLKARGAGLECEDYQNDKVDLSEVADYEMRCIKVDAAKPYESLLEQGVIEVEALCYIRGRSIPNRFFVLDEAQQLTLQEVKTMVTRMSRGSKLVMLGDPAQIDNPYVDSRSKGLVFTRNRLQEQPFAAHISLSKGERSPLAEAGAQLM
jgi:predicted ribonuclease YlaK